jgi:hypothetical protein
MARRAHQLRVEALLESIEERRWRVELLSAAGVQPAGLRGLRCEIEAAGTRLRETVAGQASSNSGAVPLPGVAARPAQTALAR